MPTGGFNDKGQRIGEHYSKEFDYKGREKLQEAENSTDSNTSDSPANDAGWNYTGQGNMSSGKELKQQEAERDISTADKAGGLYGSPVSNKSLDPRAGLKERIANNLLGGGKKKLLLGAGIALPTLLMIMAFFMIFTFLSGFKDVHFGTLLRSVGFARFQMYMKRMYAKTIFDAAVLTNTSTGTASDKLKGRTIRDYLKGSNPEKQVAELGRRGALKFQFDKGSRWGGLKTTNNFKGIEIYGQQMLVDDVSRTLFDKPYNKASARQKITVQNEFAKSIQNVVRDQLGVEPRAFRSKGPYKTFRQLTGIKMTKWANKARSFAGKTPTAARQANLEEMLRNVDGPNAPPKSGLSQIQDDADSAREEQRKAVLDGKTTTPGQTRSKFAKRAQLATKLSEAALVATLVCLVHDLDTSLNNAKLDTQDRAARLAHDAQTTRDQIVEGDSEGEAIEADSHLWDDAEQSAYYKKSVGEPVTNDEMVTQARQIPDIRGPSAALANTLGVVNDVIDNAVLAPGGTAIAIELVPGVKFVRDKIKDVGCNVILNQFVQFGIAGVEITFAVVSAGATKGITAGVKAFISGGLVLATGFGVGHILGSMIDKSVQGYAGLDYSGMSTGPQRYGQTAVGTDYLSQFANRNIGYGRPMLPSEANASQAVAMAEISKDNSQKPFTERYLALDNPYSLASRMLVKFPSSYSNMGLGIRDGLASVASLILSPGRLFNTVSGVFASSNRLVFAEAGGALGARHGVDEWGFTEKELDRIHDDPEFTQEALAAYIEPEPNYSKFEEMYRKCYTFNRQSDRPPDCTIGLLSTDDALKWRAYNAEVYCAKELGGSVYKDYTP